MAAVLVGLITVSGLSAALLQTNRSLAMANTDLQVAKDKADDEKENAKQSEANAIVAQEKAEQNATLLFL